MNVLIDVCICVVSSGVGETQGRCGQSPSMGGRPKEGKKATIEDHSPRSKTFCLSLNAMLRDNETTMAVERKSGIY